jgi:hypothetical protein
MWWTINLFQSGVKRQKSMGFRVWDNEWMKWLCEKTRYKMFQLSLIQNSVWFVDKVSIWTIIRQLCEFGSFWSMYWLLARHERRKCRYNPRTTLYDLLSCDCKCFNAWYVWNIRLEQNVSLLHACTFMILINQIIVYDKFICIKFTEHLPWEKGILD